MEEKSYKDEIERLENTMKTTAFSRYNAAERLKRHSKMAFFNTTILSLGLILIPLLQMARVKLAFNNDVLSAMQVFLAVSVLVYSVITGTARYDFRSEELNNCGDSLKKLIRRIRNEKNTKDTSREMINHIQDEYSEIVSKTENHTRNDFLLAALKINDIYSFNKRERFFKYLKYSFFELFFYIPSIFLLFLEVVFILDIMFITHIFTPYLIG
ncbi:SLATT domain-containing protein [Pectobacterium carotovorum]|uniref:SLATT domain-containing protein n=1 Tax=Pectobacterium carotovorum TaxID=554 RepID=UPI00301857BB